MALSFPTSADFLASVGGTDTQLAGTNITAHVWAVPTQNGVCVNKWGGTSGTQEFLIQRGSTFLECDTRGGSLNQAQGAVAMTTNVWHSMALQQDTTVPYLKAWRDKTLDATDGAAVVSSAKNASLRVGLRTTGVAPWGTGAIGPVSMWLVTLTDAEINALASGVSPFLVRPMSLYRYWALWGLGTDEVDLSPSAVHLTRQGSPVVANHAPVGPPYPLEV